MNALHWLLPALAGWTLSASALAADPQSTGSAGLDYFTAAPATEGSWHNQDGKVEAVRDTMLSAQVAGAITALQVKAGDQVKAGQVLLRIDSRMASQGAVASAAQVAAAQAQLAVASKEYERQKQLFAKRYISQAALDNAQAQWRASAAQVQALQAQAGVANTQSGLHTIAAPFDGIVASVPANLGDMAMPGKPLVSLYDPQAQRISAQVSQAQAAQIRQRIQAGQAIEVEIAGAAGPQRQAIAAAQLEVLPTADPITHTVTVRAQLGAQAQSVSPGMFARLWWQAPETSEGQAQAGQAQNSPIWIPQTAVLRRAELTAIYVQGSQGQPLLRQVRLGQRQGEQVEILSGLRAGELVAAQPQIAAKVR